MPSIITASQPISVFPNLYISPYGNDGVIPLYSSIPISYQTSGECLPCVLCGNSVIRQQVISQEAQNLQPTLANGVQIAVGV
jgi:hypothetical protein